MRRINSNRCTTVPCTPTTRHICIQSNRTIPQTNRCHRCNIRHIWKRKTSITNHLISTNISHINWRNGISQRRIRNGIRNQNLGSILTTIHTNHTGHNTAIINGERSSCQRRGRRRLWIIQTVTRDRLTCLNHQGTTRSTRSTHRKGRRRIIKNLSRTGKVNLIPIGITRIIVDQQHISITRKHIKPGHKRRLTCIPTHVIRIGIVLIQTSQPIGARIITTQRSSHRNITIRTCDIPNRIIIIIRRLNLKTKCTVILRSKNIPHRIRLTSPQTSSPRQNVGNTSSSTIRLVLRILLLTNRDCTHTILLRLSTYLQTRNCEHGDKE